MEYPAPQTAPRKIWLQRILGIILGLAWTAVIPYFFFSDLNSTLMAPLESIFSYFPVIELAFLAIALPSLIYEALKHKFYVVKPFFYTAAVVGGIPTVIIFVLLNLWFALALDPSNQAR